MKKRTKCLTCDNKPWSRGLCGSCLASAKASIREGRVTEQELIEAGLMLPSQRSGRPIKTGFAQKLEKLKPRAKAKAGA